MNILLVERLVPEALEWLDARHTVETRTDLAQDAAELRKAVYKAEGLLLPRKMVVTREFLDFAPKLKAVARMHVGSDNTDLEACRERGIQVIQAVTANVRPNAEYILAGLLLLSRRGIGHSLNGTAMRGESPIGRELCGSVVGLFGLGPTAHTLAPMLRGLGVTLVGYDPAVHRTAPIWGHLQIQPVSAQELLARSDAVTVQMIYASRYRSFINHKLLGHCKRGQLWVGTSRTALFDPQALADALSDGRIEACLLDGAESGFASAGTPLHSINSLMLTPRLGSHTREARLRASWYVAHRLDEALAGRPVPGITTQPLSVQTA